VVPEGYPCHTLNIAQDVQPLPVSPPPLCILACLLLYTSLCTSPLLLHCACLRLGQGGGVSSNMLENCTVLWVVHHNTFTVLQCTPNILWWAGSHDLWVKNQSRLARVGPSTGHAALIAGSDDLWVKKLHHLSKLSRFG
jgi:hypothetical protein